MSMSSSQVDFSNSVSSSAAPAAPPRGASPPKRRKGSRKSRREWEILEGLRDGQKCAEKPEKYQGFLMKRRKWPMKGWHKVRDRLQALVYDILPSSKGPENCQLTSIFCCCWCSDSRKFVTNNSDYIRRLFYNSPCCLCQLKSNQKRLNRDGTNFLP